MKTWALVGTQVQNVLHTNGVGDLLLSTGSVDNIIFASVDYFPPNGVQALTLPGSTDRIGTGNNTCNATATQL